MPSDGSCGVGNGDLEDPPGICVPHGNRHPEQGSSRRATEESVARQPEGEYAAAVVKGDIDCGRGAYAPMRTSEVSRVQAVLLRSSRTRSPDREAERWQVVGEGKSRAHPGRMSHLRPRATYPQERRIGV